MNGVSRFLHKLLKSHLQPFSSAQAKRASLKAFICDQWGKSCCDSVGRELGSGAGLLYIPASDFSGGKLGKWRRETVS